MKFFFNKYLNDSFIKNVSILASGTVVSQLVVVLISPILSRMYSVDSFGDLALFTSVSVFFAVVSTGRYELAIVLPEEDKKAVGIVRLTALIGLIVSAVYMLLIFLFKELWKVKDPSGFLEHYYSYLAPCYIFLIAIYSGLNYWAQRKKAYKIVSIATVIQVVGSALCSLIFGYFKYTDGMILSLVLGALFSCFYLILFNRDLLKLPYPRCKELRSIAKEFSGFPKYMTLSDLSLTASQQFIPVLFSALFSTTIVGFYSMANRMIRLPNIVITTAIGNVFRNDAIEEIRNTGNCTALYKATLLKLIGISIPSFAIMFWLSPMLFKLIFGNNWEEAGHYARIICIFLCVEFVATPLNSLFYIREKQSVLMRLQLINFGLGFAMIYLGYVVFNSPKISLLIFSLISALFNLLFIFKTYKISKYA